MAEQRITGAVFVVGESGHARCSAESRRFPFDPLNKAVHIRKRDRELNRITNTDRLNRLRIRLPLHHVFMDPRVPFSPWILQPVKPELGVEHVTLPEQLELGSDT